MNSSPVIHSLLRFAMIALVLSIVALFTFTGTAAARTMNVHHAQSQHSAQNQESPVGTWHATVLFLAGPFQGQQETQTITFAADGTLSQTASGVGGVGQVQGTGFWPVSVILTKKYVVPDN